MSDFNENTLRKAYVNQDYDLAEEHLKRGIKLTSLGYLFDNCYNEVDPPNELLIKITEIDLLRASILRGFSSWVAFLLTKFQPKQEHLLLACETQQVEIIKMLLNHRMIFDKECFNKRFANFNLRGFHNTPYINNIADEIELYIAAGLEITINEVIMLIRKGLYIHDIGRFNLDFNDDFYTACDQNNYWPYSPQYVPFKITDIKKTIMLSSKASYTRLINSYDKLPTVGDMIIYCRYRRSSVKTDFMCDLPVSDNDLEIAKKYGLQPYRLSIIENRLKNENNSS